MKYKDIKVSFPYQTPLLLKYLNHTLGTDYGLCYTKCKAGITDYQLQIDGSIFPCVYINDPLEGSKICDPQEVRSNNNFLQHSIEEIVKNDFFTPFYECLEKPENFSHQSFIEIKYVKKFLYGMVTIFILTQKTNRCLL